MTRLLAALLFAISVPASAYLECQDQVSNQSTVWVRGTQFQDIPGYLIGSGTAVCWADGPELAYIQSNLGGLHSSRLPGFTIWTGADADFILANL